ncbi:ABC transporter substrate-binding protein [Longispora sp. K20-0274]|uniref:ABC transporter substrate-binding protein n=1 Tax=Longispora sp. K20-0274 TaxID=3088255 RepID=UPI00399B7F82
MRRRLLPLLLVLGLAAACTSAPKAQAPTNAPGADALANAKGETTVEFWHSMKGANATALEALTGAFNKEHAGKIKISPVYQGSYDETVTKYKAAVQQKNTPALVMIYDIGTRFMVDSKQTVPMQSFVEADKFALDELEPNITNYYTVGGKLQSMPFNSSTPLLYLNKEAFDRAGLDVTKPPRTLDEISEYARKLTVRDSSGKVTQYGFNAAIYGWFVEQLLATNGEQYCDQGNGRSGLATKVNFDSPTGIRIAQWWADLVKSGSATNTGRKTDDAQAAFKSGTVAMHLESTSTLRGYLDAAKGKFTVATAPFPKASKTSTGGPVIGGASLWIDGVGHSAAEQRAAWEFTKWAVQPAQQAQWHTGTGYVPVNRKAVIDAAPQFGTAVTQLHELQPSVASAGCALGVMPQARKAAEDGLEAAITDTKNAGEAMTDAVGTMKSPIEAYNKAVK